MGTENIYLGVIGAGRWGMNHIRTANQVFGKNFKTVCDFNPAAELKVKEISEHISFTSDFDAFLNDSQINAVVIATPAETHFEVAKKCLMAGKNILVEKPITLYTSEAEELIKIAEEKNLKLMVGHILLFHPAVIKLKELVKEDKIGRLQYIYSNRLNLGAIRSEENILWSFAPHDISIIQFLTESNPIEVSAKGAAFVQDKIEDTTITYLKYPDNVNAHIFVSWLHPFKEQRLVVIGDKGMIVFEDSLKTEKLKLFPKGFQNVNGVPQKFESDYSVIEFDEKNSPLAEEQKHFIQSIVENKKPLTDGVHALEVLSILAKATENLNK